MTEDRGHLRAASQSALVDPCCCDVLARFLVSWCSIKELGRWEGREPGRHALSEAVRRHDRSSEVIRFML